MGHVTLQRPARAASCLNPSGFSRSNTLTAVLHVQADAAGDVNPSRGNASQQNNFCLFVETWLKCLFVRLFPGEVQVDATSL